MHSVNHLHEIKLFTECKKENNQKPPVINYNQSPIFSGSNSVDELRSNISHEEQEARIKAEKIKLAIEKIKEANVKKLFVKVMSELLKTSENGYLLL